MRDKSAECYNIHDLREVARKRLPKGLFEFVDRGTEDEVALANNRAAFERIKMTPRALVDVAGRRQDVTIFGRKFSMPICIAPTGSAGLMWHEGEVALAKAAAKANIPFTLATGSLTPMEKVVAEAGGETWFQLYLQPDRKLSVEIVERARTAGYKALFVTVDGIVSPNREYNFRNGFTIPFSFTRRNILDVMKHPEWMLGVLGKYMATTGMPRYENYPEEMKRRITAAPMGRSMQKNESLNWEDLKMLRKVWPEPMIVKGVMHVDDALKAIEYGADGIVVSNHGGRNFDSALAPIEMLPRIVDAVGHKLTVFVDSGFRRGSDIVKAMALGADAVLIGRPTLYGTAAGGENGAKRAIDMFRDEISRTMALMGCLSIDQLSRDYLILPDIMTRPLHSARGAAPLHEVGKAAVG